MEEFYKKKVIRDFLSQFSESKWKYLTILCIEYGILQLKKNYTVSSLSLDDIEKFVDELIEEEKKNQRKNLKQKFSVGDPKNNSNQSNSINSKNQNGTSRPSSNWRKGDAKTIFDNPNDSNERISTINDISRITKEKMIGEILFPKKEKILKYYKDNVVIGNEIRNPKKVRSSSVSAKKVTHSDSLRNQSSQYHNKFTSGLQKLKMRPRNETPNQDTHYYSSYNPNSNIRQYNTNNNKANSKNKVSYPYLQPKFTNVQSRIKSQIETDKKIYEMLKHNQIEDRNNFEERESSIIDKRSDMSFEEDFSSLV